MRLIDFFDRGAERFPERACLSDGAREWSYAAVRDLTHRIALGLLSGGLRRGGHVAVYSPNHAMAFACIFGAFRAGCKWVPVNARNAAYSEPRRCSTKALSTTPV